MADDGSPSILCADDDLEVLERLKDHFILQGFNVLTATNGVEACLQVKRWAPRAVILDLFIPRLGGIGTLARIRAFNPEVPVILISGASGALDLVMEAGLSVLGAFAKPLDLEQITETLARAGVTSAATPASGAAAEPRRPIRGRILAVDDEVEFRNLMVEYLEGKGFEVLGARDGEEALLRVPEFRPHIVLLDVMMAGMGGLEALRRIKTLYPQTCVIMVTAVEDLDAARRALADGAADYVTKPFSFQYLDSVLEVHMPLDLADPEPKPRGRQLFDHSTAE